MSSRPRQRKQSTYPVKHRRYGYGIARGRPHDGLVACQFDTWAARVYDGRWIWCSVDDLHRVVLEPMNSE